ncbi:MAG: hypothetical protein IPI67_01550 [Myxococcales bacterium]|nr:hypothetical protein [Myxococcales bacterium]
MASQSGSKIILSRFHETTGALLKTLSFDTPIAGGDARVAAVAGGVVVTVARSTYVSYLWVPETLDVPSMAFTDLSPLTTVSGISIAPVDKNTFAIAWEDGALKARLVKCQP